MSPVQELLLKAAKARAASEQILADKRKKVDAGIAEMLAASTKRGKEITSKFERQLAEYAKKYS